MKSFFLILTSLLALTACTVPGPSDFESATKPLSDDEFLVIWRYSRIADEHHVLDKSLEHKIEMEAAMAPLFQQLIPRIFSDIKNGKLTIRHQEEITDLDEEIIKDLPAKMKPLFAGSWQNLAPFMGTFHITQRRNLFTSGFPAQELELEVIAKDPENKFSEKRLGAIKVVDLVEMDYTIEIEGQKLGLVAYLDKTIQYAFPITYFYQGVENGLRTLEEAFETKELLLEGKWTSIPWIAGVPNFTGLKMAPTSKSELEAFAGEYKFPEDLPGTEKESNTALKGAVRVHSVLNERPNNLFAPHKKYVYLGWAFNGQNLSFFPMDKQSFFATSGEQMKFRKTEEGEMLMSITDAEGKEILGYRR